MQINKEISYNKSKKFNRLIRNKKNVDLQIELWARKHKVLLRKRFERILFDKWMVFCNNRETNIK